MARLTDNWLAARTGSGQLCQGERADWLLRACMVEGTMAATISRLFIAPMAPEEQPAKSNRAPSVDPMPCAQQREVQVQALGKKSDCVAAERTLSDGDSQAERAP